VFRREKLKAVAADIREGMKDNAESVLYTAVLGGEAWAICFYQIEHGGEVPCSI
jgi:hypothetical protein